MTKKSVTLREETDPDIRSLIERACETELWCGAFANTQHSQAGVTRVTAFREEGPKVLPYLEQFSKYVEHRGLFQKLKGIIAYCELRLLWTPSDLEGLFGGEAMDGDGGLVYREAFSSEKPILCLLGAAWEHEKETFEALFKLAIDKARAEGWYFCHLSTAVSPVVGCDFRLQWRGSTLDAYSRTAVSISRDSVRLRKRAAKSGWQGEVPALFKK